MPGFDKGFKAILKADAEGFPRTLDLPSWACQSAQLLDNFRITLLMQTFADVRKEFENRIWQADRPPRHAGKWHWHPSPEKD
jgi:hypothetical protein